MSLKSKMLVGTCVGLGLWAGVSHAEDKKAPMVPPEAAMMMQAAQQNMMPGANHHMLDSLAGKWTAKVSMWMQPNTKPDISSGTNENTWVLNNHYLQSTYHGNFAGHPFDGIGYMGYDNVRQEYQFIWLDNAGTGMMYSAGAYNTTSKLITQSGTFGCPMTGEKNKEFRTELKVTGPDSYTYNSYGKGPDGKEFKGMEIVYTRAK
jgi:hypothetical protein